LGQPRVRLFAPLAEPEYYKLIVANPLPREGLLFKLVCFVWRGWRKRTPREKNTHQVEQSVFFTQLFGWLPHWCRAGFFLVWTWNASVCDWLWVQHRSIGPGFNEWCAHWTQIMTTNCRLIDFWVFHVWPVCSCMDTKGLKHETTHEWETWQSTSECWYMPLMRPRPLSQRLSLLISNEL